MATFGDDCVGHPGVVHGGVTSLLFDNTLGWANAVAVLATAGRLADFEKLGVLPALGVGRTPC